MCRRWLLLLIPLFIPAGTSTLDEEAAVAPSTKMEDIVPGDPANSNAHQLFKRRFTGYKDFSKYKLTKANGRIHRIFLRNPYDTVVRSKRSNLGMLRLLKTMFVNNNSEGRPDPDHIHRPVSIRDNAVRATKNAEYVASKEENAFNSKLFNRIDKTLIRLNYKLDAMEKEKENAFIMFKVPVPISDYDRKSREKRETNDMNEDRHDDDSNLTVIAKTKPNNQQTTTTKPNSFHEIESKVEDASNNTVVLGIRHDETNKNDSASLVEQSLATNKTEAINNEEIDNKTLTLVELSNDTRKTYKPNVDDYILKMEKILDVIHIKLSPLKSIKETHSKHEEYKVGYIIANLESAEETIERLLNKMKTREILSRDQAQNILDKVTISSMVVTNLMNFLGRYSNPVTTEDIVK